MSTLKQIEANRRNAQKSTGPVTPAGKAAASMNAFKTGIYARSLIIPGERLKDLQFLIDETYGHHRPSSPELRALVDDLITSEWMLRRFARMDSEMLLYQMNDLYDKKRQQYPLGEVAATCPRSHSVIQRRIDATHRAYARTLQLIHDHTVNPIPVAQPEPEPVPAPEPELQPEPQPQPEPKPQPHPQPQPGPVLVSLPPTAASREIGFVPSPSPELPSTPSKETDHTA